MFGVSLFTQAAYTTVQKFELYDWLVNDFVFEHIN